MYKSTNHYTMFKKDGIWSYSCYDADGRRLKRSTGRKKKAEALEVIHERIAAGRLHFPIGYVQKTVRIAKPEVKGYVPTFAEYSEPFFDYDRCPIIQDSLARGKHQSRDFNKGRRQTMLKHVTPAFGELLLTDITRPMVDRWLLSLPKKAGISAVTANNTLRILSAVLDRAVFDGILKDNPCKGLKPLHEEDSGRDAFTPEEVRTILNSKHFRSELSRLACYVSASTGMRASEIRALKGEQIFEDRIVVNASEALLEGRKAPKNGQSREVPITKELYLALSPYIREPDDYLFTTDGVKPVSKCYFNRDLQEVMKKEGITRPGLVFHSFRCYLDTQLISNGVAPETVRLMLGHNDEMMTKRYLHQTANDKRTLIEGVLRDKVDGLISSRG